MSERVTIRHGPNLTVREASCNASRFRIVLVDKRLIDPQVLCDWKIEPEVLVIADPREEWREDTEGRGTGEKMIGKVLYHLDEHLGCAALMFYHVPDRKCQQNNFEK